jgi:hypothetical protein
MEEKMSTVLVLITGKTGNSSGKPVICALAENSTEFPITAGYESKSVF